MRRFGLIAVLAYVYACATGGGASRAPVTFEIGSVEAWRSLKPGMSKEDVKRVLGDPLAVAVSEASNVEGGVVENKFWEQWEYPPGGFVVFLLDTRFLGSAPKVMRWREPGEWEKDESR